MFVPLTLRYGMFDRSSRGLTFGSVGSFVRSCHGLMLRYGTVMFVPLTLRYGMLDRSFRGLAFGSVGWFVRSCHGVDG